MNKILGDIKVSNPIEIEERIIDMKARMKYMDELIETDTSDGSSNPKYDKLVAKLRSL